MQEKTLLTTKQWIPLVALAVMALAGCGNKGGGSGGGGGLLATVNNDPITLDQFHKYLEYKPQVNVVTNNNQVAQAQVAGTLGLLAFEDLLRQKLLLQMAKDEGVFPTDQDIQKELEFQKKRNPDFVKELQARGLKLAEIRESLTVDIATERLITKGIKVEMPEVDKFIQDNPKSFVDPATVDMLWVFVKDKANEGSVDDELRAGQAFAAVAKRYSQFPGAATNQRFPQRVISAMPKEIQKLVDKTGEAQQTEWLTLSDGFAKFYVEKKEGEKPIVMDDTKKEFLRRQIALERGRKATDLDAKLQERLKSAKIDVKYDDMKELWKRAEEQLKQSDLNAKTPTGGNKDANKTGAPKADDKKGVLPAPATK
jgi:parvulin-like peptidyl-prolyl isomerase